MTGLQRDEERRDWRKTRALERIADAAEARNGTGRIGEVLERIEAGQAELRADVQRIEAGQAELRADMQRIEAGLQDLRRDLVDQFGLRTDDDDAPEAADALTTDY